MSDMGVRIQYYIGLTTDEFDLVQRALRGLLYDADEIADALTLQERLMQQRAAHLKSLSDNAQKTVNRIEAETRGNR